MPSSFHILTASLITDPLRSAALILLLLIALLIIVLIVSFNICLFLCKKEGLMEGRLMASWLGTSAGSEMKCQESLIEGKVWISCFGVKLFDREISAPSALDLISLVTESRRDERQQDGRHQDERQTIEKKINKSHVGSASDSPGSEVDEDGEGLRISLLKSILAAMPAFIDLIGDLLRSFFLKTFRCRLDFGLDDPSETAILSGRLWALAAFLNCHGGDISIQPFFEEDKLEGELFAEAGFRPIHIPMAIISALRKEEIRMLIKEITGWGKRRDED